MPGEQIYRQRFERTNQSEAVTSQCGDGFLGDSIHSDQRVSNCCYVTSRTRNVPAGVSLQRRTSGSRESSSH